MLFINIHHIHRYAKADKFIKNYNKDKKYLKY